MLKNFKHFKDQELLLNAKKLVQEERRVQADFLLHLKEIEGRKIYLGLGFGSLFDYVVQELGYSESAAYRRILAMRLLKSSPEVEGKIADGRLTLTTAAQVQTFIKAEEKRKNPITTHSRTELINRVENKSSRDVERHLISLKPPQDLISEKIRLISNTHVELKMTIPEELKRRLDQLRMRLSHINPHMTYQELIEYLSNQALKKLDPSFKNGDRGIRRSNEGDKGTLNDGDVNALEIIRKMNFSETEEQILHCLSKQFKNQENVKSNTTPKNTPQSRYIPAAVRQEVWMRDHGRCSYVDPVSKRVCGSSYQLQYDHIEPYALGGSHGVENIRLLCANHNKWRAEKSFPRTNLAQGPGSTRSSVTGRGPEDSLNE